MKPIFVHKTLTKGGRSQCYNEKESERQKGRIQMSEIKVKEETVKKYSSDMKESAEAMDYLPMKDGNMAFSRANSINQLRTALFDLVEAVEAFQVVVETDATRLKNLGESFVSKDRALRRMMG